MRALLPLLVLLLSGCVASNPPRESNGGVPAGDGVVVVWHRVTDPHKVCQGLSGRTEFFNILGCAKWSDAAGPGGARVCNIYAPAPRSESETQRFATLGHELMHCFDGNWHDRYGGMLPKNTATARSSQ
jgi:hypothetical protein